ncbi:hypothetical protein Godav_029369 [Gossypium davidsonii]|uniref:Uncharacterized protein n=1 Tax=Gossypium davidsonii TaxID=34287 RepID=A0A7J8T9A7_GOSDV|nr:hypothetical protein [Gossypium davidsonii]
MHPMEEFTRFDSSASRWEKEGQCVCLEYL